MLKHILLLFLTFYSYAMNEDKRLTKKGGSFYIKNRSSDPDSNHALFEKFGNPNKEELYIWMNQRGYPTRQLTLDKLWEYLDQTIQTTKNLRKT